MLQANARESAATLARKLGIARTTVQERIARLERNGIIAGYTVILKRDLFGSTVDVFIHISIAQHHRKTIIEHLRQLPEVTLCLTVSGDFELFCRARVAQLEDVQPVLEEIGGFSGVERVRPIVVLANNFERGDSDISALATVHAAVIGRGEL